jgi:large subunit ribosomal protein L18
MSLSKPERRQELDSELESRLVVLLQPRLSVFRSNKEIYAQLIDDVNGVTILLLQEKRNRKRY